ncbi:flagellar protein FlaG [Clostridium sp. JN-1]|jgi:flagellar protein FlaG|uniref:flagellar protein FlaG n=1 Tax=Clostridium sp. JN-1 TaxID=2483110 RepID=UPI000F0B84BD|nr:flagellar protein FlaG [Clostridium sp. JN-1]
MDVRGISQGGQLSLDFIAVDSNKFSNDLDNESLQHKDVNEKSVEEKDVKKAVDKFNKLLEDKSTHLEYEVYGKFKDIVVRVVDDSTKDVIQEVPPKNIIDMIDKFCEMAGMFVDKRA